MLLTIEAKGGKGRSFTAECLTYATADRLWVDADTNARRPIFAVFAGPSEELRAFTENLKLGHAASEGTKERGATRYEFLRSVPYRWWTRALPAGGSVTSVAHPSLLSWRLPLEDAYRYRFVALPSLAWMASQRHDVGAARVVLDRLRASALADHVAPTYDREVYEGGRRTVLYKSAVELDSPHGEPLSAMLGYGTLLLHYLDARLPLPIPRDPVFGTWLLLLSHYTNGAVHIGGRPGRDDHYRRGLFVHEPQAAGLTGGFMFGIGRAPDVELTEISTWIAREVQRWHRVSGRV